MTITTGWVKRAHETKGLDPLGVQAPCISLYQQLMPGITNVTDRARYYSFYPWLIWAYNQSDWARTKGELIRWIRRGDCLFSMIAVRHRIASGDDDHGPHDAGLVGTQTLRPVIAALDDAGSLDLATFATREKGRAERYFKNDLGGLGQYYLGTLTELDIMGRDEGDPGYRPRGETLARAFDESVDRDLFVETLTDGTVTTSRLDDLSAFCPCALGGAEASLLREVFLGPDIPGETGPSRRRESLSLHLALIQGLGGATGPVSYDQSIFRSIVYSRTLGTGARWNAPDPVASSADSWATYQRNELLSLAVQVVFWVVLKQLDREPISLRSSDEVGDWFAQSALVEASIERLGTGTFGETLREFRLSIPDVSTLTDPRHEARLADGLGQHLQDADLGACLSTSLQLILTIASRVQSDGDPYESACFPADYFETHPISLASLARHTSSTWQAITTREWVGWLANHWGVEAHLRVALRKLAQQSNDTFHLAPTDTGLTVLAEPSPAFTTPRFETATRILSDLGLVQRTSTSDGSSTHVQLTELGLAVLD